MMMKTIQLNILYFFYGWFLFNPYALGSKANMQCFPTEHLQYLDSVDGYNYLDSNEKVIVFTSAQKDSIGIYNIVLKKLSKHEVPQFSSVRLLKDGKVAAQLPTPNDSKTRFSSFDEDLKSKQSSKVLVIDPNNGKKTLLEHHWIYKDDVVKFDSHFDKGVIKVSNEEGLIRLENINSSSETRGAEVLKLRGEDTYVKPSIIIRDGNLEVFDKEIIYSLNLPSYTTLRPALLLAISSDLSTLIIDHTVLDDESYTLVKLNTKSRESKIIHLPERSYILFGKNQLSSDGRYTLINNKDNRTTKVFDLVNETVVDLKLTLWKSDYFDKSNAICKTSTNSEILTNCYSLPAGDLVSSSSKFDSNSEIQVLRDLPGQLTLGGVYSSDSPTSYFALIGGEKCISTEETINCKHSHCSNKANYQTQDRIQDTEIKRFCSLNFNKENWDLITTSPKTVMDDSNFQKMLLLRFSKPGGFEANEHLKYLVSFIHDKVYERFPAEFQTALQGILLYHNQLWETLVKNYPEISQNLTTPQSSCRTKKEESEIFNGIYHYLISQASSFNILTFDMIPKSSKLLINQLPEKQRESYLDFLTNRIVYTLGNSYDSRLTHNLSPVKTFKFTYRKLQQSFGYPYKDLTDLTYHQSKSVLTLNLLGIHPFEGAVLTSGGFYMKEISKENKKLLPNGKSQRTIEWEYNNSKFKAHIDIEKINTIKSLMPISPKPEYEQLWKDNVLYGAVLISSNLSSNEQKDTINEYLRYFQRAENSFTFYKLDSPVKSKDYLAKKISNPITGYDYIVKESHSEGDERSIIKMHAESTILRGIKKLDNGKQEIFDIFMPVESPVESIDTPIIADWMKERENKQGGQLLFINASCFSAKDAPIEILTVNSPLFINITTEKQIGTFVDHEKNVLRNTVHGIRNNKSYEQIREDIAKDPIFNSRATPAMIFPDDSEYQSIIDRLGQPVNIHIQLKKQNKNGNQEPYPPPGDER